MKVGLAEVLSARVLDLSGPIGCYCSKLLADLGADVVLVEPPGGDRSRRTPPLLHGSEGQPYSAVFASYNANKRGITLDLSSPAALPVLAQLGRHSEVIIVSPTTRRPLVGFDRELSHLSWAPPDALVVAITPFGLTGPWRDLRMTPFLSFAMSGAMHRLGRPDGPPQAAPGQLAWDEAGIHAALGVLAVLLGERGVRGQMLDISVHEVAAAKDFLLERFDAGEQGWGRANAVGIPPTGVWQCADGLLSVAAHQRSHWGAFLTMMGNPPELSDPAYGDPIFRREAFDLMEALIAPMMRKRSRLDLFRSGQEAGLPCAPYNTPAEYVVDPQPLSRETFHVSQGVLGPVNIPWRWGQSAPDLWTLRRGAPGIGEHNRQVYVEELGFTDDDLTSWSEAGLV